MCRRSRILTVTIDFEKHAGRPATRLRVRRFEKFVDLIRHRANDLRFSHCHERQLRPCSAPVYTPSTAHDLHKLGRSASFEPRVIRTAPSRHENDTRHQDDFGDPASPFGVDDTHCLPPYGRRPASFFKPTTPTHSCDRERGVVSIHPGKEILVLWQERGASSHRRGTIVGTRHDVADLAVNCSSALVRVGNGDQKVLPHLDGIIRPKEPEAKFILPTIPPLPVGPGRDAD